MRVITQWQLRIAYSAVVIGVVVGAFSFVRIGSLIISAGACVISLAQWNQRRFERYFPLLIALALFGLAIALPKGL
jgi:hypothetical protein